MPGLNHNCNALAFKVSVKCCCDVLTKAFLCLKPLGILLCDACQLAKSKHHSVRGNISDVAAPMERKQVLLAG